MPIEVIVPQVGEVGMEVEFIRWLKVEGDLVTEGEPLFEVDTQKATLEVEALGSGRLADLRVQAGDLVEPRQVVALLVVADEAALEREPESAPAASAANGQRENGTANVASAAPERESSSAAPPARVGVSPKARAVARALGVDPMRLAGTGPGGLVTETDVRAAATAAATAAPARTGPGRAERTRQGVAERTSATWRTVPHFHLRLEADVTAALSVGKPTSVICAAAARALVEHPECNLAWDGERLVRRASVDLGILVDSPDGLLLSVVADAAGRSLSGLAEAIGDAAKRARDGALQSVDFGQRSLSVSNLGTYAVDSFTGVIASPDVMLLTVGRVRTTPRWDGAAFQPRQVVDLTLAVDHRALDGADAARYLTTLEAILADPSRLG